MFLVIALMAGVSGGIIAWINLIFRIIYFLCGKRRLKSREQMAAEIAAYEGTAREVPAADAPEEVPEPEGPHPEEAERAAVLATAEKIAAAAAGVPDAERAKYINNIIADIKRQKEERELINAAAEEYRTAALLCPDIDIAAVTAAALAVPAAPSPPAPAWEPKKRKEFIIEEF